MVDETATLGLVGQRGIIMQRACRRGANGQFMRIIAEIYEHAAPSTATTLARG